MTTRSQRALSALIILITLAITPAVIQDYMGARNELRADATQAYMQHKCERMSNAEQTDFWYECEEQ